MRHTELPQDIQDIIRKESEIEMKYAGNAGWYDRTRGDNIRLGRLSAQRRRLIERYGLDEMQVAFAAVEIKTLTV